ncbi:MAG: GNAT family N-acetyltransferase [Sandaracinaceae bacterium]
MAPRVRLFSDAGAFLDASQPLWDEREAELNLLIGVAFALERGTLTTERLPLLAVLEEGGTPRGAALRTPPHGLVLAALDDEAARALAIELSTRPELLDTPSVVGADPQVEAFVNVWCDALRTTPRLVMSQRILSLTEVVPPPRAVGRFRPAEPSDLPRVGEWIHTFAVETLGESAGLREDSLRRTRAQIENRRVFVWERDGEVVSTASLARPTPRGVTVNAVYTPEEHRGNGYATSCVAALSLRSLDEGAEMVCLYTDATNPTSNAIYERIGYAFVARSAQWSLREPDRR